MEDMRVLLYSLGFCLGAVLPGGVSASQEEAYYLWTNRLGVVCIGPKRPAGPGVRDLRRADAVEIVRGGEFGVSENGARLRPAAKRKEAKRRAGDRVPARGKPKIEIIRKRYDPDYGVWKQY